MTEMHKHYGLWRAGRMPQLTAFERELAGVAGAAADLSGDIWQTQRAMADTLGIEPRKVGKMLRRLAEFGVLEAPCTEYCQHNPGDWLPVERSYHFKTEGHVKAVLEGANHPYPLDLEEMARVRAARAADKSLHSRGGYYLPRPPSGHSRFDRAPM